MIFVFDSNLAGRHGKGTAATARRAHGAEYGIGKGRTGNAYAIPTKDEKLNTLPLERIKSHVQEFIQYARDNPDLKFKVTPNGMGSYGHEEIAPMFKGSPENCELPLLWRIILLTAELQSILDESKKPPPLSRQGQ